MGLVAKLFRSTREPETHAGEHAVIVHFSYGSTNLQHIYAMEDQLRAALSDARAGEYDGREVALDGSDGTFFLYGPDAEALFRAIHPVLAGSSFMRGATVTLRFGPAKRRTPKRVIELPS